MTMMRSVLALFRIYALDEPEAFRVAEQFGIDDMPVRLFRLRRAERALT
jgi:hypothetical protein